MNIFALNSGCRNHAVLALQFDHPGPEVSRARKFGDQLPNQIFCKMHGSLATGGRLRLNVRSHHVSPVATVAGHDFPMPEPSLGVASAQRSGIYVRQISPAGLRATRRQIPISRHFASGPSRPIVRGYFSSERLLSGERDGEDGREGKAERWQESAMHQKALHPSSANPPR